MLSEIWTRLQREFFPERIDLLTYTVTWSVRRQRRVLASVSLTRRIVKVANEMNHPDHHHWLPPLLYHEMCHAVIGESVTKRSGKKQWHGAEFKELERIHPMMDRFDAWVKTGGWRSAVLSARARQMWQLRKKAA